MDYRKLIDGMKKYGSTERDICLSCLGISCEQINECVIVAPWWEPDKMPSLGTATYLKKSYSNDAIKIWGIENNGLHMTYIKTGIGAPFLMDTVLALGVTGCKRVIFIGSVGSLDPDIGIGDIVIPEYSVCGDGASRYISFDSLTGNDAFRIKAYPDREFNALLLSNTRKICTAHNIGCHTGRTFSIDTIFAQYAHIEEIIGMSCNTIEMETASAFRAAELTGIPLAALFSVSDNTVINKSLISGRTEQEQKYRKYVRKEIIPEIIVRTFLG